MKYGIESMNEIDIAVVDQAVGMISAQLSVNLEEALFQLRACAVVDDRPVVDLAQDVVDRRIRFDT
jgi:hypothetical protein